MPRPKGQLPQRRIHQPQLLAGLRLRNADEAGELLRKRARGERQDFGGADSCVMQGTWAPGHRWGLPFPPQPSAGRCQSVVQCGRCPGWLVPSPGHSSLPWLPMAPRSKHQRLSNPLLGASSLPTSRTGQKCPGAHTTPPTPPGGRHQPLMVRAGG